MTLDEIKNSVNRGVIVKCGENGIVQYDGARGYTIKFNDGSMCSLTVFGNLIADEDKFWYD